MKFKLNQRVYCKQHKQYGKIIYVSISYDDSYPLVIKFDGGDQFTYTEDGRYIFNSPISLIIPLKDKLNKLLSI